MKKTTKAKPKVKKLTVHAWIHPIEGGDDYPIKFNIKVLEGTSQYKINKFIRNELRKAGSAIEMDFIVKESR